MKLSVIIPFYNLAPYVRECLDSVVAAAESEVERRGGGGQRMAPLSVEVICVDDGSTDETGEILDSYAAKARGEEWRPSSDSAAQTVDEASRLVTKEDTLLDLTRRDASSTGEGAHRASPSPLAFALKVVHQSNAGEGAARNAGLDVATGDWITYLDGDDLWLPNMLTEAVPLLAEHADADIVNLRFAPFEDGATAPLPQPSSTAEVFDAAASIADKVLLDVGVYPTFFRRSALGDLRFSALPLGADRLYVAQCLAQAKKVVMSDAVVHAYRVRVGSMARATWTARKAMSQCDYAAGALAALSGCGKRIGSEGVGYLASLWLSDVPSHVRRLRDRDERRVAAEHWAASFGSAGGELLSGRRRFVLRLLRLFARRPLVACEVAHAFRILGVV